MILINLALNYRYSISSLDKSELLSLLDWLLVVYLCLLSAFCLIDSLICVDLECVEILGGEGEAGLGVRVGMDVASVVLSILSWKFRLLRWDDRPLRWDETVAGSCDCVGVASSGFSARLNTSLRR